MGRSKPKPKRNQRRTTGPASGTDELARLQVAWDRAVSTGLMPDGNEVNYRALPTGEVLSDAIGTDGQLLIDGQELTAEWTAELRRTKPAFAGLVDVFAEKNRGWQRISEMGPCEHAACDCPH